MQVTPHGGNPGLSWPKQIFSLSGTHSVTSSPLPGPWRVSLRPAGLSAPSILNTRPVCPALSIDSIAHASSATCFPQELQTREAVTVPSRAWKTLWRMICWQHFGTQIFEQSSKNLSVSMSTFPSR